MIFLIFITVFQQIAMDTWIKSAFSDKDKGKAGLAQALGLSIGSFIGADLFLLLNSQAWVDANLNFFGGEKGIIGKVTHTQLMLFLSLTSLLLFIYLFFFTSEPTAGSKTAQKEPEFCEIVTSSLPHFVKNRNNLLLIGYVIYINFFLGLLETSTRLQLIKEGFPKTDIATINTICIPVNIFGGLILGALILKQGLYMREFHMMMYIKYIGTIMAVILVSFYFTKNNYESSYWIYLVISFFKSIGGSSGAYYFAFVVYIADPRIGASAISIYQSISNFSVVFSVTVSLWILEYVHFAVFGTAVSVISFISFFLIFPLALKFDKTDAEEQDFQKINFQILD